MLGISREGFSIIMTLQHKKLSNRSNYLIDNNYKGKCKKQKKESNNKNKKSKESNSKERESFMKNLK